MIQIFGTTKCKGTRAAQRYFSDRRIPVQVVDLREKGLSKGELASVARAVGSFAALYDPTSPKVTALGLQYAPPSEAKLATLLIDHPALLRTPIVRHGSSAAVGVAEERWAELAAAARG
jgi:arsenate reductase (glutaredoxin)